MRLLFLALHFPLPPNNGHKMRAYGLLRALAAEGHGITLLSFAAAGESVGHLALLHELCEEVEVMPIGQTSLTRTTDYAGRLRGLVAALPYTAKRFASSQMAARIRSQLARQVFDAVVADSVFSLVNLPPTRVPVVLNNVDIEHVILQRYLSFTRNPAKQLYARLESRKLEAWERTACARAAVGMACSEQDRRFLEAFCPGVPITIVPNVIDTEDYTPADDGQGLTVLYQGAMDWYPNRDAVEFFVTAILPQLRTFIPDAKFIIAGRNPSEEFRGRFARIPGIQLTGTVPDMRPVIARAAVCVVPLRIGSGTRLKILEAAAMGKPIVSTRLGAEGLNFVDGQDIVLADEPRAFARAVADLLTDIERRARLGSAARHRVEQEYSFPVLCTALRRTLKEVGL